MTNSGNPHKKKELKAIKRAKPTFFKNGHLSSLRHRI
jgi:hypothetical protein